MKEVTYDDLINQVKAEVEYFQQGGTSWRRQVASLSLTILSQSNLRSVKDFTNKMTVKTLVKELCPSIGSELTEDIGEFISHTAMDMLLKQNLPIEVKEYVEMQKRNRKGIPLRFKGKIDGSH